MPSTSQQCTTRWTADQPDLPAINAIDCSHFAAAAHAASCDALPTVSEHCSEEHCSEDAHLPLIRVPSSVSEVDSSPTASGPALVSSTRSGGSTGGSGGVAYVTPYMPPFGSNGKAARHRKMSDASQTASASLQTVLSLAAKMRSPSQASAMYKGNQARGRGRAQSSVSAAATTKTDRGMGSSCQSSTSKGKIAGDTGLMSQSGHAKVSSSLQRYSSHSLSG